MACRCEAPGGRGVCPACSGKSDGVRAAGPPRGPGLAAELGVWGGQRSGPHVAVLRTDRRGGAGTGVRRSLQ